MDAFLYPGLGLLIVGLVVYGAFTQYRRYDKAHKQVDELIALTDVQREELRTLKEQILGEENRSEELTFMQRNTILSQKSELDNLTAAHKKLQDKTNRVESQKKSSEVKLGLMAENFMPFIRDYPYDHKKFRFLANPVDGIQITDDAVIFIEFKTGAARLSRSQRAIKDMVSKGQVRFETFRVNDQGTSLKIESDMLGVVEPEEGE